MQMDPSRDWQALGELYRQKSDEELEELARDYADLTEVAREVLRGEMKARGLADPAAPRTPEKREPKRATARVDAPEQAADGDEEDESAAGLEYTWKTPLCTCATIPQAKQIAEMLRRAKIESWIEGGMNPWDAGNIRVVVAADELDEARAVMANPIPQDVVDESTTEAPEYVAPVGPACGAEDPVLESVEPVNHWLCESCGKEWDEGAAQDGTQENVTAEAEEGHG